MQGPGRPEGQQHHRDGRQRVQPGAGKREPAERRPPQPADGETHRESGQQLVEDEARDLEARGGAPGGRRRQRDEHDRRGVVETRLRLEDGPHPGLEGEAPQHREHGGGVGGGDSGTEEDRRTDRRPEHEDGEAADDGDADQDADGRQHRGDRERPAHLRPPRGEAALGEDDRERDEAELGGEGVVLEAHAEARLADHEPEREVDQEGRHARPAREPDREHGDEEEATSGEHDDVGGVVHRVILHCAGRMGT